MENVLDYFEFKMYQSKRKINFAMYQSKKNNFIMLSEKKFYNVSEQVKNFKMYQSKLNFLRCIKVNKISKDVSEQVGILKYIRAYLNF